ncbi:SDR family NAD(P)-dependent oxidoreductase [Desmospora activa]|uniref:Short subunit dehydrogenase n=1 Tax=Desmospora activa DSM 45169 TaxID=1121389 RepID=A0A2T4ZD75_9BACL|nr:SDR family oxidoreductase [Desmospora activa]PTM59844.1 short subunit dehydrogenase [Desmospora activa DSM 45169]
MPHSQKPPKPNKCYVCKQPLLEKHAHYPLLCLECGDFNEKKRLARHDLHGYTALVTGGRTKIGYYTALRLLRDGAQVIITSRFPYTALHHYLQEADCCDWQDRIHIYGLDFRRIERVEAFARFLDKQFPSIDIIINNAAQTVRMREEEYVALAQNEQSLQNRLGRNHSPQLSSREIAVTSFEQTDSPPLQLQPLQPVQGEGDAITTTSREYHSWTAQADQIPLVEMLEVQLINVTAPFLLNTQLKPAMVRSPRRNRFIINVSSIEGKFSMKRKNPYHVHTNMAKASLNMMTLTMAKEYKKDRIYITSVDPGWVSDQIPQKANKAAIQLPLDFHDAAARICDPIYMSKEADKPPTGLFFKDYQPIDW